MIEQAITAHVPFNWVAADSVYGVGDIEMALRRKAKGYVPGVSAKHRFNSWGRELAVAGTAEEIADNLDPSVWQRLSAGEPATGRRKTPFHVAWRNRHFLKTVVIQWLHVAWNCDM